MYTVLKKFYDPFKKTYVKPGDKIEIPERYLEGYLPYITPQTIEVKKAPTLKEAMEAPPMQMIEREKKKKVT